MNSVHHFSTWTDFRIMFWNLLDCPLYLMFLHHFYIKLSKAWSRPDYDETVGPFCCLYKVQNLCYIRLTRRSAIIHRLFKVSRYPSQNMDSFIRNLRKGAINAWHAFDTVLHPHKHQAHCLVNATYKLVKGYKEIRTIRHVSVFLGKSDV